MALYGKHWSLNQQQQALRVSYVLWLIWLGLGVPLGQLYDGMPVKAAFGMALLASLPLWLLAHWVLTAKHGRMLILAGMIILIYLGAAALAILHGGLSLIWFGIETILILNVLYWLMWVIERLPRY